MAITTLLPKGKEEGTAAYVEQDKVYFTEPIAFNMEQEELALTGTHNLFNSMAAGYLCQPGRVSAKSVSARPWVISREWNTALKKSAG